MSKSTNLPINPTDLLKKQIAEANQRIGQSEAKRVKLSVTGFTDPNGDVGEKLEVVVVDYTMIHSYFDKAYDPDNIEPPKCYANNRIFQELAPVEDAPEPQADSCAICPQNRFGSAANGKAKACRNYRLLAVIPASKIDSAPVWTFSVSPTSTRRWDDYVRELMKSNLTPMFAKTEISFERVKTYAKPIFEMLEPLTEEETAAAIGRLEEAKQILDQTPDWSDA